MNWKAAFIWTIVIFVIVGSVGYHYHKTSIEYTSTQAWWRGYEEAIMSFQELQEDTQKIFDLGYTSGYQDAIETRDAYGQGYDVGFEDGYRRGYDDADAGYLPLY